MSTQPMLEKENKDRLSAALATAGKIAEVGIDFAILKKRVENAVDDAVTDATRVAKHGRHAVEDVIEDMTYWIKKNPWRSVGYAVGAGLGIGVFVGWITTRLSVHPDQ
jgi:ElaB/YqjD/DUF883 family membrane-anchored ribosome-binding protein